MITARREQQSVPMLDPDAVSEELGLAAWQRPAPEIPEVTISRLPLYYRLLSRLEEDGRCIVSSRELAEPLGMTPAQIRRDLSYFGRFGTQGRGYSVQRLTRELRGILGLNRRWTLVLVGIGRLGGAIASYRGFEPQGFDIVALYDAATTVIGASVGGHTVRDVGRLESDLLAAPADIGIVAVPAEYAQSVINTLVRAGVRAIVSYAPRAVRVPAGVQLRQIDPTVSLHSITYHLKRESPDRRRPPLRPCSAAPRTGPGGSVSAAETGEGMSDA